MSDRLTAFLQAIIDQQGCNDHLWLVRCAEAELAALRAWPSPLTELVDKWRTEAAEGLEKWPRGAILPSKKLRQCADELDAALRAWRPRQAIETKEDAARVAPLTAGDDGQDLPQSDSGEKSPMKINTNGQITVSQAELRNEFANVQQGPAVSNWEDTPLQQAKRTAFDYPSQENLDALILAAKMEALLDEQENPAGRGAPRPDPQEDDSSVCVVSVFREDDGRYGASWEGEEIGGAKHGVAGYDTSVAACLRRVADVLDVAALPPPQEPGR